MECLPLLQEYGPPSASLAATVAPIAVHRSSRDFRLAQPHFPLLAYSEKDGRPGVSFESRVYSTCSPATGGNHQWYLGTPGSNFWSGS